ncbi:MAG TPA: SRPBCC family protein [Solirubrobacteraceae bacterium]|nr:SRPBCC family protein [Solirubrobacteraceae bacterium]
MKLEQSFTVAAPVDAVWAALVDVQRVAPCLPGAQVTEVGDDGTYHGQFTVKLGPTTAAYNGTLKMEELDEAAHAAVMSARGTDRRGQGGASATIRSTVSQEGDVTRVDVDTDFTITGRLARFGRGGMIEDVSRRLMRDFAGCLQSSIDAEQRAAAGAAEGGTGAPAAAAEAAAPETVAEAIAEAPPAGAETGEVERAAAPAAAPHQRPHVPHPHMPHPHMPAKPLNAIELVLGVLKDRLVALWKRLGAWLRGRSRGRGGGGA